jgi:hypothetical protein
VARKTKIKNVLEVIKSCVEEGRYQLTIHAEERMIERAVTLPEVLHVLRSGWHERKKDRYSDEFEDWDYAIRSQTNDKRSIRIAVAVEELSNVVVITVIDLDQ